MDFGKRKVKVGIIMNIYVGNDIIEVDRVKEAMKDPNFKIRFFTDNEIAYCEKKGRGKYQSYAARFAAKEAVFKAISPKIQNKFEISWKNVEILKEEKDRPFVNLIGVNLKKVKIDISISHLEKYAVATAIAVFT